MKYISTRGEAPPQDFKQVLLSGMAPDGGLYVPQDLPRLSADEIESWRGLSYPDLALEVITPFIGSTIPRQDLQAILNAAYAGFAHPEVTPLRALDPRHHLLELFHGPTLAFKDIALQVLGRLLDYFLSRDRRRAVVLGATSGDTGSAALEGCRHCGMVDIFILHPEARVSEVQRRQMTTVPGDNVFNLAVKGSFDDCQRMVKAAFADQSFLTGSDGGDGGDGGADRETARPLLIAVNSINWARIMMQIVYYFAAALKLDALTESQALSFSVPTGNFGDIYAGYLAHRMGLPVERLIVATNSNDILHRFISTNDYSAPPLSHTWSPSMDILVSSNFERYLFDLFGRDSGALRDFMARASKGPTSVGDDKWHKMRKLFDSASVDDEATCQTIADEFAASSVLLDPHTAVGLKAARLRTSTDSGAPTETAAPTVATAPVVTLATAHPAKFSEAITAAGLQPPSLPPHLADLFKREECYDVVHNNLSQVTDYIRAKVKGKAD